jgi:hypothetical protein
LPQPTARILARTPCDLAVEHGEPVAALGQSVLVLAILLVGFRIPRAAADARDQFRTGGGLTDFGAGRLSPLYRILNQLLIRQAQSPHHQASDIVADFLVCRPN